MEIWHEFGVLRNITWLLIYFLDPSREESWGFPKASSWKFVGESMGFPRLFCTQECNPLIEEGSSLYGKETIWFMMMKADTCRKSWNGRTKPWPLKGNVCVRPQVTVKSPACPWRIWGRLQRLLLCIQINIWSNTVMWRQWHHPKQENRTNL